jgi:hypothetical protein
MPVARGLPPGPNQLTNPGLSRKCHPTGATSESSQKMTCGIRPSGICRASNPRSSSHARSRSIRAQTIAWKQESQNHWNGYRSCDGMLNR